MNLIRNWGRALILALVALMITTAYARKYMPSTGEWRVVTLYFHSAFSETAAASGSMSTDGSTLDCTLPMSATDYTADDDLIAGDDVTAGDDITAAGTISVDYGGTGTEAYIYGSGAAGSTSVLIDLSSDGVALKGPSDQANPADTTMMTVTTSTLTATLGLTLPDTKDIIIDTDGGSDIGTESASVGAGYFKTIDADTSITSDGRLTVGTIYPGTGCPDLASATTIAPTESCHNLTGSTAVEELTTGSFTAGDRLLLIAAGSITMTAGNDIVLPGGANFDMTAGDTVEFVFSPASSKFTCVTTSDND